MTNEEFQKLVLEELFGIKSEMSSIKSQLNENTQIIKALMHRTEELDAKFDGLLHTTATKEAINSLEAKIDALNARLFHQEADIQLLKKKAL